MGVFIELASSQVDDRYFHCIRAGLSSLPKEPVEGLRLPWLDRLTRPLRAADRVTLAIDYVNPKSNVGQRARRPNGGLDL